VRVLAGLRYDVPDQDLTDSLRRIPTRPRSGFVITGVTRDGQPRVAPNTRPSA
jgi:fatty-acid peroxygenase